MILNILRSLEGCFAVMYGYRYMNIFIYLKYTLTNCALQVLLNTLMLMPLSFPNMMNIKLTKFLNRESVLLFI